MRVKGSLIYRCNKSSNPKVPFLITSESIGDLSSMSNIDIISLRDINLRFEDRRKLLRGIGLEITVSDLRRADGKQLGKWIADISSFYAYVNTLNSSLYYPVVQLRYANWFLAVVSIHY